MNKPKSKTLFHFTKSPEILKSIIKNGIYPRFCLEEASLKFSREESIAYLISCFCDIPLSRITEHTNAYGEYGLGLTKVWAERNGLSPVIYFTKSGSVLKLANYLMDFTHANRHLLDSFEYRIQITNLIKLMKPVNGKVASTGALKDFYQENEWRYAPEVDVGIPKSQFTEKSESENKKAEEYKLNIYPNDIKYIFVKEDADISEISDFIGANLSHFPHADIKILQSRIISLETIRSDL